MIAWCVLEHCCSKRLCHCPQKRDHPRPSVCHRHSYGSCHPASRERGHPCCLTILMHLLQIKHPLLAQAQDSGRVALTGVIVIVFWGQMCSKGALSGKVSTLCGRSSTPQNKRSRSPTSLCGCMVEMEGAIFPNVLCALCSDNFDAGSASSCPSTPRWQQTADAPTGV